MSAIVSFGLTGALPTHATAQTALAQLSEFASLELLPQFFEVFQGQLYAVDCDDGGRVTPLSPETPPVDWATRPISTKVTTSTLANWPTSTPSWIREPDAQADYAGWYQALLMAWQSPDAGGKISSAQCARLGVSLFVPLYQGLRISFQSSTQPDPQALALTAPNNTSTQWLTLALSKSLLYKTKGFVRSSKHRRPRNRPRPRPRAGPASAVHAQSQPGSRLQLPGPHQPLSRFCEGLARSRMVSCSGAQGACINPHILAVMKDTCSLLNVS